MFHIDGRPALEKPLIDLPHEIFEEWKNGVMAPAIWGTGLVGTGSIAMVTDTTRGSHIARLSTGAVAGGRATLYGQDDYQARSGDAAGEVTGYDNTSAIYYTVLDFEARLDTVASIENSVFFMGFCTAQNSIRTSQDIIGFMLALDALNTITDIGGLDTITAVPGPPDLDDQLYHYRILLMSERIVFMRDHAVVTIHTVNLPNDPMYPVFVIENDGDVESLLDITNISIGYRRYPSQILVG